MKALVLIAIMSLALVSCSSLKDKFQDSKVAVAKTAKDFVTKELKSGFSSENIVIDGVNCESEAEEIGLNVENELLKFLKAEAKVAAMVDQSLTADVLPAACKFVNEMVVPSLIAKIPTAYVCTRKLGSVKLVEIGKDLCDEIK